MHNSVDKVYNMIDKIRNNIFDYNIKEVFNNIDFLIHEISNYVNLEIIPEDKINVFNTILQNINLSIQNKDYLLLSDILKFQLKDFVENI